MQTCRVTLETNLHELEQDRAYYRAEAIDALATDLVTLGEECYPYSVENLTKALNEIDLFDIAELMARGARLDAANLIDTRVREYWEKAARIEAERMTD